MIAVPRFSRDEGTCTTISLAPRERPELSKFSRRFLDYFWTIEIHFLVTDPSESRVFSYNNFSSSE